MKTKIRTKVIKGKIHLRHHRTNRSNNSTVFYKKPETNSPNIEWEIATKKIKNGSITVVREIVFHNF